MVETIYDGVNFFKAMVFSVIIWGSFCVAAWYYHFSEARRTSWNGGGLSDFLDLFPEWLMNSILTAWFIAGTFPLINYVADKEQFGSVVGRARELGMFDERPFYGEGGYQFLVMVLIIIAGYLINRYRNV